MRILIIVLSMCLLSSCGLVDEDWSQHFYNNSDNNMYFHLRYYKDGKVFHPAYDEISEKPFLNEIQPHSEGWCSMWPTTFRYGTLGHMYAFSPDTLERYSWEEILAKKKYWFTARPCQLEPIQFPEEFEYMGDM
jgi:lipoprotein